MICPSCGAPLEASYRFCGVCGKPTTPSEVDALGRREPPPEPEQTEAGALAPRAESEGMPASTGTLPRTRMLTLGLPILLLPALLTGLFLWIRPRESYGPPAASSLNLIMSPAVTVDLLPSAGSLSDAHFDHFDLSPSGAIVVGVNSKLFDMTTGEKIFRDDAAIQSFAFTDRALIVTDSNNQVGYLDFDKLVTAGPAPVGEARLNTSSDRKTLLFRSEGKDHGSAPALATMREGIQPSLLTNCEYPLTAACGDGKRTIFAVENLIFEITRGGELSLLLRLPDPNQGILGLGLRNGSLLFSTAQGVYALQGFIAQPVVLGLGGDLRLSSDGSIYLLERAFGRIYRIHIGEEVPK